MNILFTILAVLVILASVLVTIVVLLQNGKGGGLASNFVAGNQTFGVRQTADILEKITWGLAAVIVVLAIASNFASHSTVVKGGVDGAILEKSQPKAQEAAFPTEGTINLDEAAATPAQSDKKAE